MECSTMGRVTTEATIENVEDAWALKRGLIQAEQVRRAIVPDALIDTGATTLALPARLIRQLGLSLLRERPSVSSTGAGATRVYDVVRLTIQGRMCSVEVMEVADDVPVLVGQVPLDLLDLVVDCKNQRLTGNPAHGGEQVLELY